MSEETEISENEESQNLTTEQEESLKELQPDFEPVDQGGESKQQGSDQTQVVEMLGLMITGVFSVLAVRLGPHWQLQQAEAKAIAEPAGMVLEKYFPDMNVGPELALVGAVSMVVFPRAMTQLDIEKQKAAAQNNGVVINGDQSESEAG